MAPQVRKHLSNIEIDEISLVDRGANQHARTVIAKRAPEEDTMPELYDEEGNLLPEDIVLDEGDVVFDGDGQAYEFVLEDEDADDETEEEYEAEPELVGKGYGGGPWGSATGKKASESAAAFGGTGLRGASNKVWGHGKTARNRKRGAAAAGVGAAGAGGGYAYSRKNVEKSFRDEVMEELSKAYSDEERDQVIAKAFDQVEEYSQQAWEAEEIAKSERDLRLTREYIEKAADYNVPISPEELGPVLYRMAETMDYDDCAVIHKALESSGAAIFEEYGHIGGGDNADVMSQVQAYANEYVGKSADEADTISKVFEANPDAYEQYLAEQRGF